MAVLLSNCHLATAWLRSIGLNTPVALMSMFAPGIAVYRPRTELPGHRAHDVLSNRGCQPFPKATTSLPICGAIMINPSGTPSLSIVLSLLSYLMLAAPSFPTPTVLPQGLWTTPMYTHSIERHTEPHCTWLFRSRPVCPV